MESLVKRALSSGGRLVPLIIPSELTAGSGLMNPSVFIDKDGDVLVNLRHVNYTLYHSENNQRFNSPWGPLTYIHPENYVKLATINYLCLLNSELEVEKVCRVDTSELDVEPLWEFVGLEDARVVYWDDKYFLSGVRRDTTPNGQGRMELSELELDKDAWTAKEISRFRIPTPINQDSYCEKNWMPVLDADYQYIKWTSPTELVQANPVDKTCLQLLHNPGPIVGADQRGGSQVFKWNGFNVAITHEVDLTKNYLQQKDGIYRHRFIVWDTDWNIVGISPNHFSFLGAKIEFCAGAAVTDTGLLLSFGFQDNAAFILDIPKELVNELIEDAVK